MTIPDPTANPPPAMLKFLNERGRIGPDGALFFADDDGSPILDFDREGCPNADARGVAKWSRTYRPELWQEAATVTAEIVAETKPTPTFDWSKATMTDKMIAARQGDAGAMAALGIQPPTTSALAGNTMSALMARARGGDAAALTEITSRYLDPTR